MILMTSMVLMFATPCPAKDWIDYEGHAGPGNGKHIVLLSGDEEYRSEEGLPMLAKILSQRHGFKCSVLFSVDGGGIIDPGAQASLTGAEALDSADAIVMLLRLKEKLRRRWERRSPSNQILVLLVDKAWERQINSVSIVEQS